MFSEETKSLIHLNLMQDVGSKTVQLLIERFGSAEEALNASSEDIENEFRRIGKKPRAGLIKRTYHYQHTNEPLTHELELITQNGCQIITLFDEEYPSLLKYIDRPPVVLYVKGKLKTEDTNSVAIVGPRKALDSGQEFSRKLSSALAKQGMTVVSGLAKGIDTCAHRGSLDAGGRTIAVLGTGLNHIYPPENKELAEEIIQSGALISEFPMDIKQESVKFPQRNRIISGLTLGTVVVEAPNESGSLITAKDAKKQGRKVFAVPGQINPEHLNGCHKLIKNGAQRIDTVNDFLDELPQLSVKTMNEISAVDTPEQMSLFEDTGTYAEKEEGEEKVKSEVISYFESTFPEFDIKLEYEILIDGKERADVALIYSKQKVAALVECKQSGIDGEKQLHEYLSASTNTNYGIMANSTNSKLWNFYEKTNDDQLKPITSSEFEKGVMDNINTK